MLVKLTSSTSGEMIMFAKHARRLFEIIGKECTARGVFIAEQLPEAIDKLHRAVNDEKQALLEAPTMADRCDALTALLEIDSLEGDDDEPHSIQ